MISVGGGVESDLGAEDRMGILEFSKCSLEKGDVRSRGFREEDGENSEAGATRHGFAPAEFGVADGSGK